MKTWKLIKMGRTFECKCLKAEMETLGSGLSKLEGIRHYWIEQTGVIGHDERSSEFWSPFSPKVERLENQDEFNVAVETFLDSIPDQIKREEINTIIKQAKDLFSKYVYREDCRWIEEDHNKQNQEYKEAENQREIERKQKYDSFIAQFGQSKMVAIPDGSMAITLQFSYNNSDSMSDYFDPHSSYGETLLLGIVKKGQQREATARKVLANYPDLMKYSWSWHKEEYSMGHGTYLQSEWTDFIAEGVTTYGGYENPRLQMEIQFNKYVNEIHPYKDYPGVADQSPDNKQAESVEKPTVRHNEEKNGIEVLFPEKPNEETLKFLRERKFRFHRKKSMWYNRYSDELYQEMQEAF